MKRVLTAFEGRRALRHLGDPLAVIPPIDPEPAPAPPNTVPMPWPSPSDPSPIPDPPTPIDRFPA